MVRELINKCSDEIKDSQEFIDEAALEYDKSDDLYKKNPDETYVSDVGEKLNAIENEADIVQNRNILRRTLYRDMLYHMITGERLY